MKATRAGIVLICLAVAAGVGVLLIPMPKRSLDLSRTEVAHSPERANSNAGPALVAGFRETRWHELMPNDWDPYQQIREMQKGVPITRDRDPRAVEMLKKMRDLWDNAPINPAMDGASVRIPGYVVPIGENKLGMKEFLLVPYFGACIHSPPPPSNQIIHVVPRKAVTGVRSMDAVWIGGTLKVRRSDSSMGVSSYGMDAINVEPYTAPKRE